jgi:hypothetical protein
MSRHESIALDSSGNLTIKSLQGADKIVSHPFPLPLHPHPFHSTTQVPPFLTSLQDPGNDRTGLGCLHAVFAVAAAEFGDVAINTVCLKQLDETYHPVFSTPTGSLKNKSLSTVAQGTALRARLIKYQDWRNMMTRSTPAAGPILAEVPFPEVLAAKARGADGRGLEFVLYNGREEGEWEVGVERLEGGRCMKLGVEIM